MQTIRFDDTLKVTLMALALVGGLAGCSAPPRSGAADAADGRPCSDTVVGGPVYVDVTYAPDGTPINPGNCRVASGTEVTWRGPGAEPVAFEIRFKAAVPLARGERGLLRAAEAGGRYKVKRTITGPSGRYDYSILANGKELDPAIIIR